MYTTALFEEGWLTKAAAYVDELPAHLHHPAAEDDA